MMRFFGKIVQSLLFLLLFFNNTFADTLLDNVELDSGYRNYSYHIDIKSPDLEGGYFEGDGCANEISLFGESDVVQEGEATWTYIGQGLYKLCGRGSQSSIETSYSDSCSTCTRASSYSEGMRCSDENQRLGTIFMQTGSVTMNFYSDYSNSPDLLQLFGRCSYSPPSYLGNATFKGDSSYTFGIKCEGEKIARILRIEAGVMITSESQVSVRDFLMNGNSPYYIKEAASFYSEYGRVYYWMGALYWDIPIYARCGESITVTPSLTSAYTDTRVSAVRAIFDCPIDVNVPSLVMPKKTGNNVADVAITLLTPAPSGGVDVKLTVEPVKNSGGHIEDGNGHSGARQKKGEITDDSGKKIDTITFTEGESQKMVKYKADEVSGEEKIIAEIVDKEIKCEETVNVKVPGLIGLGGGYYSLKTQPSDNKHTSVYNVSSWVRGLFNRIAATYNQKFPNDEMLVVNDASLAWGGLYDFKNTWNPPHTYHRIGTDIDVRSWNIPSKNRRKFEEFVCENYGFPDLEAEGLNNEHYHLYFFPYNSRIVTYCTKSLPEGGDGGGSGGDGGGGDIPT